VHPCTGRTAHRESRGIALPFLDHGTRRGLGVSVTPRPLFTPKKDPVPIVHEAGWALGPFCTGAENLAPHRDSIPGPSSQTLYRLNYPADGTTRWCSLNMKYLQLFCIFLWPLMPDIREVRLCSL
jgi:hypothetical protein